MINMLKFGKGNVALFVGGAVFSCVTTKFLKSSCCKKLCVKTVATGLCIKDNVEHKIATIKEEAEDLYSEAKHCQSDSKCCCEPKVEE